MKIEVTYDRLFDTHGVQQAIDDAIAKTMKYGRQLIQNRTPVDTGVLRAGWEEGWDGIYNEVTYTSYVEHGTRYYEGAGMVARSRQQIEHRLSQECTARLGELYDAGTTTVQ